MKFTLGWLKEHLDTDADLDRIAHTLTDIGLEVEEVEDPAALYAPFKVAYVESAVQHPDADRLRVCIVDTGTEKIQVVCGAPNARTGMKSIFAPDGSYIPGTKITLKKGKIRGQDSNGMLVSEREMDLPETTDGIIDLPADTPVGTPLSEIFKLNDPVIEIGLTPNRADCAGIYGIARDLAAAGLGTLKPVSVPAIKGTFACPVNVTLATDACPHFVGRLIKGVTNGPSPDWLQQKLKAIGLRPISALVDITNYMTYAYNRPLHVFDADKLKGGLTVRLSKDGETFKALNDKTYTLNDQMVVIADDSGVLGLGGVMGGTATGVDEHTKNVYIEAAYFDPMRTARTGRALQISSDARYRFERGIDPAFTEDGLEIAAQMVLDLCGGEASERGSVGKAPDVSKTISFDPAFTTKRGGIEIDAVAQKKILIALGFDVQDKNPNAWDVTVPSWRGDVTIKDCLVEEVLRIYGFNDVIPVSVTRTQDDVVSEPVTRTVARAARTALISRGMEECVTWSFMPKALAAIFGANDNATSSLIITNPISAELDQMRPSLLPNLIMAARENANRGYADCALFEIGPSFQSSKADGQTMCCTGVRTGAYAAKHWSGGTRPVDIYDLKADVLAALAAAGAPENLQISRDVPDYYHPGRSGRLGLGKNTLAYFGELHPQALSMMDIDGPVIGFEIFLNNIPAPRAKTSTAKPLLKLHALQPVHRDFAFILDESVEADTLIRTIKGTDKNLIANVNVFDIYQGKGVEPGKKSVALAVTLQPLEQTLTDSDIDGLSKKIIDAVTQKTGGQLRG